jgi:hypothetical protein
MRDKTAGLPCAHHYKCNHVVLEPMQLQPYDTRILWQAVVFLSAAFMSALRSLRDCRSCKVAQSISGLTEN